MCIFLYVRTTFRLMVLHSLSTLHISFVLCLNSMPSTIQDICMQYSTPMVLPLGRSCCLPGRYFMVNVTTSQIPPQNEVTSLHCESRQLVVLQLLHFHLLVCKF
ncbi:hypothetical protein DFJ58DRAFT_134703 [Suillus subalutaceus]|uniref:uncharacterized protein n=1 Tax=Suillus subalutaceus TaxID=48586 RepID=UPI001B86D8BA|nr:uncharacterized protein DFJ58DRAFT_134703 [Suillus subalutaceus]KAG1838035.1 hypothetical protein DFJ58DRAFT_134703 [Suillus subalutaceus]